MKAVTLIVQAAHILLLFIGIEHATANDNTTPEQRGAAIFYGEIDVPGHLDGHNLVLPTLATRCANCHEEINTTPSPTPNTTPNTTPNNTTPSSTPFAHTLTSEHLQTPQTRRGGPPSVFNAQRLCTLLRTGIDPVHIVISTTMPRYHLTDAQCEDIWAFLETR
jgi:hypothetical protein